MNEQIHDRVVEGTYVTVEYDDGPIYEYRVVCSDGMFGPMSARDYEHAESVAAAFTNAVEGAHYHTIERRLVVGPWEAT